MTTRRHQRADILERGARGSFLVCESLDDPVEQHLAVIQVAQQRAVDAVGVSLTVGGVQRTRQPKGGRGAVRRQIRDAEELSGNAFGCRPPVLLVADLGRIGPSDRAVVESAERGAAADVSDAVVSAARDACARSQQGIGR